MVLLTPGLRQHAHSPLPGYCHARGPFTPHGWGKHTIGNAPHSPPIIITLSALIHATGSSSPLINDPPCARPTHPT